MLPWEMIQNSPACQLGFPSTYKGTGCHPQGWLSLPGQFLLCHRWWFVLEASPPADLQGVLGREQHAEGRLFEWGVEHPLDPLRRSRSAGPRTQPWPGPHSFQASRNTTSGTFHPLPWNKHNHIFCSRKARIKGAGNKRLNPISHCSPSSQSATRLQEL